MIHTLRTVLRPYVPDDWERVHLYASIPEFSQYDVWGPNSVTDTKRFIEERIAAANAQPLLRFEMAVVLPDEDVLIGGCGLKLQDAAATEGSLGYAINPDFQKSGYATEVALALINFAFGGLRLDQVYAECDTRNEASRRVMEKAGMRESSIIRDHRQVKGRMTDSYRYVIQRNAQ